MKKGGRDHYSRPSNSWNVVVDPGGTKGFTGCGETEIFVWHYKVVEGTAKDLNSLSYTQALQ